MFLFLQTLLWGGISPIFLFSFVLLYCSRPLSSQLDGQDWSELRLPLFHPGMQASFLSRAEKYVGMGGLTWAAEWWVWIISNVQVETFLNPFNFYIPVLLMTLPKFRIFPWFPHPAFLEKLSERNETFRILLRSAMDSCPLSAQQLLELLFPDRRMGRFTVASDKWAWTNRSFSLFASKMNISH